MFILRFIGRILSIGFILFIVFVISGKSARAEGALDLSAASVTEAEESVVAAVPARPTR